MKWVRRWLHPELLQKFLEHGLHGEHSDTMLCLVNLVNFTHMFISSNKGLQCCVNNIYFLETGLQYCVYSEKKKLLF